MPERYEPHDEASLIEAVQEALASETPLALQGLASRQGLGRPVEADSVLSLTRLDGINFYEPDELVLCAKAGTPLAQVREVLSEKRQMLAFEPPNWGALFAGDSAHGGDPKENAGTLGGLVSCNVSGPRRFKAGALRDHLLGFRAVSGRAELFKSGGRVMKNVTGYDLSKLIAGSYGTLAALSEVTLKVLPQPETSSCLVIAGLSDSAALEVMTRALQSSCEPTGAAHLCEGLDFSWLPAALDGAAAPFTCLRIEGPSPSVVFRLERLKELLPKGADGAILERQASEALWRGIADLSAFAGEPDKLLWRVSLPPSQAADYLGDLANALPFDHILDWGGGLIWIALDPESCGQDGAEGLLRAPLREKGGHATLFRAPESLRRSLSVFQPLAPGADVLTRKIKEAFDPRCILNPGRLYPAK